MTDCYYKASLPGVRQERSQPRRLTFLSGQWKTEKWLCMGVGETLAHQRRLNIICFLPLLGQQV